MLPPTSDDRDALDREDDAAPHRVWLDLPAALYATASELANERGYTEQEALLELLGRGAAAIEPDGTRPALALAPAPAASPKPTLIPSASHAHAAWRTTAPPSANRTTSPHEWAEHLVEFLPLRFQKYIEELLFDDERILFFHYRPMFRIPGRALHRGRRQHEGVFMITDRMVLMMQDAIPPGPMFVAWGYSAWMTAIERVVAAEVDASAQSIELRITCSAADGEETHAVGFAPGAGVELSDALALLNRYGRSVATLPARRYAEHVPEWEPPERRHERLRIAGRISDEPDEPDIQVAVAEYETSRLKLSAEMIEVTDAKGTACIPVACVSSVGVWHALTGCTLDLYVPDGQRVVDHRAVFQYPRSMPFMRVAMRLRHYMGRAARADE